MRECEADLFFVPNPFLVVMLVRVGVVELFFFVPNPFLVVRFFIQATNVEAGCFMALRFQTAGFVQPVGLLGLACVACSTCS